MTADCMTDKRLDACRAALDEFTRRMDGWEARLDPPVSEEQRRAMYAARAGRGILGIPIHVAEEFLEGEEGGEGDRQR